MRVDLAELGYGWREGLLILVVILVLYMLFEILRLRRLRQDAARRPVEPQVEAAVVTAPEVPPAPPEPEASKSPWGDPPAEIDENAAFRRRLENELFQMRDEIDALRGEFAALREEVRHAEAHLKASQSVSPLYSEAMQMAMNGHSPEAIAERCGIARAEAELVAALVKNGEA